MDRSESHVYRRRRSEVFRNIDDSLKVLGVLSMKSLGLLFLLYAALYLLDVGLGLSRLLFGRAGALIELLVLASAALVLSYAERQDDEHLVPAMLRFHLSRRSRVLYSAAAPDGRPDCAAGRVLSRRVTEAARLAARPKR